MVLNKTFILHANSGKREPEKCEKVYEWNGNGKLSEVGVLFVSDEVLERRHLNLIETKRILYLLK